MDGAHTEAAIGTESRFGRTGSHGIPDSWVERQIRNEDAELSVSAIEKLEDDRDRRLKERSTDLGIGLSIWYWARKLKPLASDAGLSVDEFLDAVVRDLANGVSLELRDQWLDDDGIPKLRVVGEEWALVLWRGIKSESRIGISCLESVSRLKYPNLEPRFRPRRVKFNHAEGLKPTRRGFPKPLLDAYQRCLQSHQAADDAVRRLTQRRDLREMLVRQVRAELSVGHGDAEAALRRRLAAELRQQLEPLRQILHLLRMRTEDGRLEFVATVVHPDINVADGMGLSNASASLERDVDNVWIEAPVDVAALEGQGARIKLRRNGKDWTGPIEITRSRVVRNRCILEARLSANAYAIGEIVEGICEPRFRWRAHQQAVNRLFRGDVAGYWPSLARAVCLPNELEPLEIASSSPQFFCDSNEGAPSLNDRQREAVLGALSTRDVFCIQGPPGTGKTAVICELIQQLAARGERVLLASTTHEAVNEVLSRIGDRDGIRALRTTVDVRRASAVQHHLPSRVLEPFMSAARLRGRTRQRHQEGHADLESAISLLGDLVGAARAVEACELERERAAEALADAESALRVGGSHLRQSIDSLKAQIRTCEQSLERERRERLATANTLQVNEGRSWFHRLIAWFGLGEVARLRRQVRAHDSRIRSIGEQAVALSAKAEEMTAESHRLEENARGAQVNLDRAMVRNELAQARAYSCRESCELNSILGSEGCGPTPSVKKSELELRLSRQESYRRLALRFEELLDEDLANASGYARLATDVLALANLICCTASGIAGSPELRGAEIDTIIIDEASRLTDSEFLIGAVRAKRWILVGDEQQLPPFVDQNDEHFVHALLALHQAEGASPSLEDAVEELSEWWHEDEEHHKFRIDSVSAVAASLLKSGVWAERYRDEIANRLQRIRKPGQDAVRTMLSAVQRSFVRSVFERIVDQCPQSKRGRLVEQRRMIDPIAEIVRGPIYSGEYTTPAESRDSVMPLATPTFPKPVVFLNTSKYGRRAEDETVDNGFVNRLEADWIVAACGAIDRDLIELDSTGISVSILAFYQAQASLIAARLESVQFSRLRIENCSPIDGMQGKESDLVLLSFCRATSRRRLGPRYGTWLQDVRRLNVACTRAKRGLILVGHKDMLTKLNGEDRARAFYDNLARLFAERPESMQEIVDFRG